MHYKDGTEAKLGDLIEVPANEWQKHPIQGYVVGMCPGADACNLTMAYCGLATPYGATCAAPYPTVREGVFTAGQCSLVYRAPPPNLAPAT